MVPEGTYGFLAIFLIISKEPRNRSHHETYQTSISLAFDVNFSSTGSVIRPGARWKEKSTFFNFQNDLSPKSINGLAKNFNDKFTRLLLMHSLNLLDSVIVFL